MLQGVIPQPVIMDRHGITLRTTGMMTVRHQTGSNAGGFRAHFSAVTVHGIEQYPCFVIIVIRFGCHKCPAVAHRAGLWVIKTELLETQTVDFTLGSQGLRHTPGDIIEICDNDYAGTLTGGRVLSIDAATRTLTLDREVTLPETGTSAVNLINGSGKPVSVDITAHPAPDRIQVSTLPDGVETVPSGVR